jgi:glycosyltransferase involved in cell wall biosynthesis
MTAWELARTRRHEGWLAARFDTVLVSSSRDREALARLAGESAQIGLLPNGVDLDYFTPNFERRSADTVVLTGKMSYHANITAALHLVDDVMPLVWAQRPGVRVEVVGQAPPREVRALAARQASRVAVTGYVSDLRPYLWSAAVAAAPILYGAGTQNKVLEAMACAAPVVATSLAVSALTAQAGREVLVCDGPQAQAEGILRLLADAALRREVGRAGREYVARHHRWQAIAEDLAGIYREFVGEPA